MFYKLNIWIWKSISLCIDYTCWNNSYTQGIRISWETSLKRTETNKSLFHVKLNGIWFFLQFSGWFWTKNSNQFRNMRESVTIKFRSLWQETEIYFSVPIEKYTCKWCYCVSVLCSKFMCIYIYICIYFTYTCIHIYMKYIQD